jgi:hypothetical protein
MPTKSNKFSAGQIWTLAMQTGTFASVVVGIVMIPIEVGRRDQILTHQQQTVNELRGVVSDLVKTTINLTGTDRVHDRDLEDLRVRLEKLEAKRG